jgi:hypothetical protein
MMGTLAPFSYLVLNINDVKGNINYSYLSLQCGVMQCHAMSVKCNII